MKKLVLFTLIMVGCSPIKKTDYSTLNCCIIEIKEYQYAFRFKALNETDTILIISLKENYYDKYGYKKPILNHLQEIAVNEEYDFF
jgi:hypothetical protein